jgi:hypothetical protein
MRPQRGVEWNLGFGIWLRSSGSKMAYVLAQQPLVCNLFSHFLESFFTYGFVATVFGAFG